MLLTDGLNRIEGFRTLDPTGDVLRLPERRARLQQARHHEPRAGAVSCCEGADDKFGVACLGGECFGEAGAGFLRFSCAEPNDRLQQALDFIPKAITRTDRLAAWLDEHPQHRLVKPYAVE